MSILITGRISEESLNSMVMGTSNVRIGLLDPSFIPIKMGVSKKISANILMVGRNKSIIQRTTN